VEVLASWRTAIISGLRCTISAFKDGVITPLGALIFSSSPSREIVISKLLNCDKKLIVFMVFSPSILSLYFDEIDVFFNLLLC
jgi:hypothetical protein